MAVFAFEIYWGTSSGTLLHDTIEVGGVDFADAEASVYRDRPRPTSGFAACARNEYFDDYYDVEIVGQESVAEQQD